MLLVAAVLLLGGYGALATFAYRRGGAVLAACAAGGLAALAGAGVVLGVSFGVPDVLRIVVYMLAFLGPAIVVPTWILGLLRLNPNPYIRPFPLASAAALAGLAIGYLLVVYGFVLWL